MALLVGGRDVGHRAIPVMFVNPEISLEIRLFRGEVLDAAQGAHGREFVLQCQRLCLGELAFDHDGTPTEKLFGFQIVDSQLACEVRPHCFFVGLFGNFAAEEHLVVTHGYSTSFRPFLAPRRNLRAFNRMNPVASA